VGVLKDRAELARYENAVPGAQIVVCRLTAQESLRVERLRQRLPPGSSREWHVRRTVELEEILVQGKAEDFTVANDERSPRQVAQDGLNHVGWL
jgi:adenylylsulfate kinase